MQTTIFLLRHGETDYNRENRIRGNSKNSDFAKLTEKGIKHSELLKERLKKEKFDVMYSSPLRRSMETAKIVKPIGLTASRMPSLWKISGKEHGMCLQI